METSSIVIVGGGLVGQTLAERLSRDGNDVTLIEHNGALVTQLLDTLDIQVIHGNGAIPAVLRAAGIERASLVVASTDSDECNVVVGLLAAQLFRVPRIVVRVRDPGHEEGFAAIDFGADVEHISINPDTAAVDRISSLLEVPGALDVTSFMDSELMVAGFRIDHESDFVGLRVSDMRLLFASAPTLVVAIRRRDEWIVPDGREEINAGDLVYFAVPRAQLGDILGLLGVAATDQRRVLIAGATPIGLALARRLAAADLRVVLIEESEECARVAVDTLSGVLVVHGSATDKSLLDDEEIERFSAFVAVTPDHETNLVAGLLAKRLGVDRSMALVDNPALVDLVGDIGVDAIISQRLLTIGLALQVIRGGEIRSGAALLGDEVEIIEVEVVEGSRLTAGPLIEVGLPRGVLVAARHRGGELLVPQGRDSIEPGDQVLIISTAGLGPKLTEFLEG